MLGVDADQYAPLCKGEQYFGNRLAVADMQFTGDQLVKAYRSMCTIREFGERMHKEFTTRQIPGFVDRYASTHRAHGHSIGKGTES